ncbi:eCIS core domain-containing protein [Nostoc sp.]|uniref:eCIS core domain-containing protein n=1 Tax=Nostoc sp. TaxID=1180 RepID=UPI002FF44DB4
MHQPASVQLGEDETVQREEMETKDNEARLMRSPILQRRSSDGGMAITPDLEASINQARGGGQPMANNIRQPMEKAFGADFSGVKIHTNSQSDQLNQSIQARAFTTGQDVFFRQGEYNPASRGGQELIAHELTHVVQQNVEAVQRSPFPPTQLSQNPDTESSVQLKPKDIKNTHTLKVDNTGIITNAQADRNDPPVSYPLSIAITKGVLKSKDSSPVGGHLFKREYGGADDYSNVVTWSQKSEDNFTIFENQYLAQARANAIGNGGVSREVQTEATFTDFKVDLKDIRLWINKPQMEA